MTEISRFPATVKKVVEVLKAAGLTAFDGPEQVDFVGDCVWIGYNGDPHSPNGIFKQGETKQEWAGSVGAKRRDEDFDIICSVIAVRGDGDTTAVRDTAYDLLGVVESTLRANPGLDFGSPYVAGVRPRDTYIELPTAGTVCRITFMISVKTRV